MTKIATLAWFRTYDIDYVFRAYLFNTFVFILFYFFVFQSTRKSISLDFVKTQTMWRDII